MKKTVSFDHVLAENAALEKIEGGLRLTIDQGEGVLVLPELTGEAYGSSRYFVLDVLPHVEYCEGVQLWLREKSGREMTMTIDLFPGVVGRIVFRLDLMDGSLLFPPLTPGTMKSIIHGQGVEMADVVQTELRFVREKQENRVFEILGGWLDDELPEFPKAEYTTTDVLGQWKQKLWQNR